MSATADVILGIQWGDEGKGRVVDYCARDYDIIARFGGGDNAGHSIIVGEHHIALRIVPSGVLYADKELFIGGGTVVSLQSILEEFEKLRDIGIDISRIKISDRAHIVFPYHCAQDRHNEETAGKRAIGTTGRGIGPAYADKAARVGVTVRELYQRESLAEKIRFNLTRAAFFNDLPNEAELVADTLQAAERILPHVVDGVAYIHSALDDGKRILIEGAQGTLLDVGYGTYPYVTSSHTIAGGACIGLGIGPTAIRRVVGVAKAYCTRVGAGPFPSELHGQVGEVLRRNGREFGTVTGRPRRCGWFDAVAARYAIQLNGLSEAIITKLDVLTGLPSIGLVTGYEIDGRSVGFQAISDPNLAITVQSFDGWNEDISDVRAIAALPKNARAYVGALAEYLRVPIKHVSLGPERTQLAS
ncbi:MAG: adenylosuccinate synthase [Candidatus Eremiobacteraeota bacterium]|nr:adenylosuccinate synthase [Candidatus Eremiobacteraeota bacterium]